MNIPRSSLQTALSVYNSIFSFALSTPLGTGEDGSKAQVEKSASLPQARSLVMLFFIIASGASSPVPCGVDGAKYCVMLFLDAA